MAGFKIIDMPGDCLLLTAFHLVSDTNIVQINFESNRLYVLSKNVLVQNQRKKHSLQFFENPYVDNILLSSISGIFFTILEFFQEVYQLIVLLSL